jgi:hypothetical protein
MPKIPTYESQVDIKPQSAPQVEMQNFTGGWKNATEAFKVADGVVKEFKKVRDYNEVSDAEMGLRVELGQIENEAFNDRDPNNAETYKGKIDDAIARHSSKISDKGIQRQATDKFNLTGYSTYSSISNDFRKKSIDIGQANYLRSTNQYELDYSSASNDVDRKRVKEDWVASLEGASKAGLFAADDIERMRQAQTKKFDERDLMYDIQNIPDQVATRRSQGFYSSLTNEEVQKGLDLSLRLKERKIKEDEVNYKKMVIENERGITNALASGNAHSIDDISQMVGNQEISQEFGQAYIKYISSPESVDYAEDKNGFAKYAEQVFKSGDNEMIQSAIKVALEGGADWLGVALLEEAIALRKAGITAPILAWLVPPGSDFKSAVDTDIDIAVSSIKGLEEVGAVAGSKRPRIHLEVDTGMTRGGFLSEWNEIDAHHVQGVEIIGIFSHFA